MQTVNLGGILSLSSVALNASGQGFIGGTSPGPIGWAGFVNEGSSAVQFISPVPASITQVALNQSGQALFGGSGTLGFVNVNNLTPQNISGGYNNITSVSLNNLGDGLVGDDQNFAAFVTVGSSQTQQISTTSFSGAINSVSMNDLGQGLIGWDNGEAAIVTYGQTTATAISLDPSVVSIHSVAMNSGGEGLIGGILNPMAPQSGFAAFVSYNTKIATPIDLGAISNHLINSVALNDLGQGLIVGDNGYAAFVNASTNSSQMIGLPTSNQLLSAAINNFGQGLIGGNGFAAFVDINAPYLTPVIISLPGGMILDSVSLSTLIPLKTVQGVQLTANNLAFAQYINENAPQKAFYLLPSVWQDTLLESLQNAAPTRNAITLYTADQNLFYLNHALSTHLRNWRHFKQQERVSRPLSFLEKQEEKEDLLVYADALAGFDHGIGMQMYDPETKSYYTLPSKKSSVAPCQPPLKKERSTNVWFEALGVLAFQDSQHQTVGFDPSIAGGILAIDGTLYPNTQLGLGIAYTFTDITEDHNAGSSYIHQEYVFGYMTASYNNYYLDAAIWGAMFQIHQTRRIQLVGWTFESTSAPTGWQISPHLELGFETFNWANLDEGFLINPFVMFDWANAFQNSYEEKGSGPFNAGQKEHYSSLLRSEAGLRFYEPIIFCSAKLLLEQKVSYVSKAPFHVGRMNTFLVGSPGSFTVETLSNNQNLVAVEASIIFDPLNPIYPYWSFGYQGEFGHSFQSHQLLFELSWEL